MKTKVRYFIIIVSACLLPSVFYGQQKYDTLYIESYKQKWTIITDVYAKSIDFSIYPLTHIDSIDKREIKYLPNVSSYYGLSASYKGWGLGVSTPVPFSKKDDSLYGKTTAYDYRFSLHKRKFGGMAYLRYYNGFYLNNPSLFDTSWTAGGVVPHREDMSIATVGFNAYYLFNHHRFSMKSVMGQTEWQRKSASTFIIQADVNLSMLESDRTLIPLSEEQYFQNLEGFQDMFQYSVAFMGGFTRCFAIPKYIYICPMLFIGPGYQHKNMNADGGHVVKDNLFLKSDFKIAMGMNSHYFYLGMLFDADSNFMPAQYAQFKSTVAIFDFFLGCRF
jgi:hypothetical protein